MWLFIIVSGSGVNWDVSSVPFSGHMLFVWLYNVLVFIMFVCIDINCDKID